MEQPTDLNAYRTRRERENAEDEVRYLSYCIQLKLKDLQKTQELHRDAARRLHALGNTAVTESEWLGNSPNLLNESRDE